MAKFVIAGKSNCPYFAKAELLGDQLSRNLSDFKIHKIVKEASEWDSWVSEVCEKNGWKKHTKSPIVWRELVNRGGKGMYLGDHNDFQEYARDYYGSLSELNSDDLRRISSENEKTHVIVEKEKKDIQASIKPFNVTITNPDSPVVYYLLDEICRGAVFGRENEISIKFYTKLKSEHHTGLQMEAEDLASDKLRYIKVVDDVREAFTDCDFAILIDEVVDSNPYIELARAIDEYAKTTCKILITPFESRAETYALVNVFSQHLNRIDPKTNLVGNSLSDEMELKAILAHRLKVSPAYIKNVFIIGQSTNDSFYVDLLYGQVTDYDGAVWARVNTHWLNLVSMVADKDWIRKELMTLVYDRSNLISQKTNRKRNMMFAQSIKKLCNLWTTEGNNQQQQPEVYHSAIVYAKDRYTVRDDVYISVPVEFVNGTFNYVNSYQVSLDNQSVLEEIVRDTKKRISANYNGNSYENRSQELKLSIPHVIYEK